MKEMESVSSGRFGLPLGRKLVYQVRRPARNGREMNEGRSSSLFNTFEYPSILSTWKVLDATMVVPDRVGGSQVDAIAEADRPRQATARIGAACPRGRREAATG
jgi:hypothetical protein